MSEPALGDNRGYQGIVTQPFPSLHCGKKQLHRYELFPYGWPCHLFSENRPETDQVQLQEPHIQREEAENRNQDIENKRKIHLSRNIK